MRAQDEPRGRARSGVNASVRVVPAGVRVVPAVVRVVPAGVRVVPAGVRVVPAGVRVVPAVVLAVVVACLLAPVRADAGPRAGVADDRASGGHAQPRAECEEAFPCEEDVALPERWDRELDPPGGQRSTPPAPPIGEVLGAAYAAAGLDREPGRGLVRRARLSGLVPLLSVRTARTTSWRDGDLDVGHGSTMEVRATWRLDRLVFEGRELQVASLEAARRRERRGLASRVIRVYFLWRRAAAHPRSRSRALEAQAELDALTDGWFSTALQRARAAASRGVRFPDTTATP